MRNIIQQSLEFKTLAAALKENLVSQTTSKYPIRVQQRCVLPPFLS